jgi:hypothetical protein
VALVQVFLEYFGFPCQLSSHRLLHTHHHLSSGAGTICQTVADVPSRHSLTPPHGPEPLHSQQGKGTRWYPVLPVVKTLFLWDTTPCSPMKVNRRFGKISPPPWTRIKQAAGRVLLATWFMLVSLLAYSSSLKMEATCSSEILFDFQRITRCSIPEDRTLHNHCCEDLKSYIVHNEKVKLSLCLTN